MTAPAATILTCNRCGNKVYESWDRVYHEKCRCGGVFRCERTETPDWHHDNCYITHHQCAIALVDKLHSDKKALIAKVQNEQQRAESIYDLYLKLMVKKEKLYKELEEARQQLVTEASVQDAVKAVKTFNEGLQEYNPVSHPQHYNQGIPPEHEPRKVIASWTKAGWISWYIASTIKYLVRYRNKGKALEDLQKAKQYLEWEIETVEKENK